jgi:integrase
VGPPKSRYGRRTVRLSDGTAQRLWRRQAEEHPAAEDLVWTAKRGERVNPANVASRVLKPAARKLGLGWVHPHTFRHTCATALFRHGMNAVQVQRWLGHHKPSFTLDTYVHLLDEDLTEDTGFLDEMVGTSRATSPADTDRQAEAENDADRPVSIGVRRAV